MTEFFQYLLTPFQYFSELGLGVMLASVLAGVISFTGTISNFLDSTATGPNTPPEVITVTVATTPNATGPSVNEIIVGESGTTVYVSGRVQDTDGCSDISSAASVNVTMFPQQLGSCASAGGYCFDIPASASSTTLIGCENGTTVDYATFMTLQPIPIPADTPTTLTVPYTVQTTVTDVQGATGTGQTGVLVTHPGNTASGSQLPFPGPSAASVSSVSNATSGSVFGSPVLPVPYPPTEVIALPVTPRSLPTPLGTSTLVSPSSALLLGTSSSPPTAFVVANTPAPEIATVPNVLGSTTERKKPRAFCTWLFCLRY